MNNTTTSSTINIEPQPNHCVGCGAEYRNIQHPLKPPGVIMARVCDCKLVAQTVGPTTVMTLVPPTKAP